MPRRVNPEFGLLRAFSIAGQKAKTDIDGQERIDSSYTDNSNESAVLERSPAQIAMIANATATAGAACYQLSSKDGPNVKSILKRPSTDGHPDKPDQPGGNGGSRSTCSSVSSNHNNLEVPPTRTVLTSSATASSRRNLGQGDIHHSGTTASVASGLTLRLRRVNHHVGFGSVEVREYARTVGDNPSVSSGPPISLDWEYDPNETRYSINEYETMQLPLRCSLECELAVPRQIREEWLLHEWHIPQPVVAAAVMEVIRVKNQRRQTIHKLTSCWNVFDQPASRTSFKVLRSRQLKSKSISKTTSKSTTSSITIPSSALTATATTTLISTDLFPDKAPIGESSSHSLPMNETGTLVDSRNRGNPLDDSFDYGSYYRLATETPPTTTNSTPQVDTPMSFSLKEVDEACIAELAAKLWESAAVSKAKKTLNEDDYTTTSMDKECVDNPYPTNDEDETYVDPDVYNHPHLLLRPDPYVHTKTSALH